MRGLTLLSRALGCVALVASAMGVRDAFASLLCQRPVRYLSKVSQKSLLVKAYPNTPRPTIEHVVPQSYTKKAGLAGTLSRDMHNLVLVKDILNQHRSNYRLTIQTEAVNWTTVEPGAFKSTVHGLFVPPIHMRGPMARAVGYVALAYPEMRRTLFQHVLDPCHLLVWHTLYPPTMTELWLHDKIAQQQDSRNAFVTHPERATLVFRQTCLKRFSL